MTGLERRADGCGTAAELHERMDPETPLVHHAIDERACVRARIAQHELGRRQLLEGDRRTLRPRVLAGDDHRHLVGREDGRAGIRGRVVGGRDAEVGRTGVDESPHHRRVRGRQLDRQSREIVAGCGEQLGQESIGDDRTARDPHGGALPAQVGEDVVEERDLVDHAQRGCSEPRSGGRRDDALRRAIQEPRPRHRLELA
ncbi:MAG: hypothetical protein PGN13_08135 [Patulibacter minatonensis]